MLEITLLKQRSLNKTSRYLELYTVLDVKSSMITASRATDQKEVTRNSSYFKKLPNPPGSTIPDTEPVPVDEQVPLDIEGPVVCQPTSTSSSQAYPSETNSNQDNTTLAAAPPVSSCSGRLLKNPGWMKDYVMT